jgi:ATP-dependent Clp protease, protease subunit
MKSRSKLTVDDLDLELLSSLTGSTAKPKNTIWVTSFDESFIGAFYEQFMALEADPSISIITIFISSYGGDAMSLIAIRDLVKTSSKAVATVAVGKAMSAGMFLLAAGSKGLRFASPNTQIMIHEVQTTGHDGGSTTDIKRHSEEMAKLNEQLFKTLKEDVGAEKFRLINDAIKKLPGVDLIVDPKTAKEWGIIDRIEIPRVASTSVQTGIVMEEIKIKKPRRPKATKKR